MRSMWMASLVTAIALWAGQGFSQADELIRLGGSDDAKTMTLGFDGDADTQLAHWRHGGYRGYYGGYRGGYYGGYRGFYGGYRHGYYGGYSSFAFSFGRPYYYGSYYGNGGYYRPYYYPAYYPSYSYYYYPCAEDVERMPNAAVPGTLPSYAQSPPLSQPGSSSNGTYPYDGGPRQVIPLPTAAPPPSVTPPPPLPREGRLVSVPAPKTFTYPAYGESSR